MCYDISFTVSIRVLGDYFPDLVFDEQMELEFGPIDHVQAPGVFGKHPVIFQNRDDNKLHCELMEWGIIEHFQKEEPLIAKRNGMLNIRSERILDDAKSYWYKIRNRRCLVPVTGIYEHREVKGWKKKVPYWIRPCDQMTVFLPGLYSVAEIVNKETGELIKRKTYGIITRGANSVMRAIHNGGENSGRMPLFLPLEIAREFVNNNLTPERYKELLAFEMPSNDLVYHPVYTIRSPKLRSDGKNKNEQWIWDNLPGLEVTGVE